MGNGATIYDRSMTGMNITGEKYAIVISLAHCPVAPAERNACRYQSISAYAFVRSRLRPTASMIAHTTTATVKNDAAAINSRASG